MSKTSRREFIGATAGSALALAGLSRLSRAAADSGQQEQGAGNRPNILWIMTDEQRTHSLGCYGNSWTATPNLDGLANRGVLFNNAFVQSPICVPSRATMLTGKYGHTCDVLQNNYRLNFTAWHRRQIAEAIEKMDKEVYEERVQTLGVQAAARFEGKNNWDIPDQFKTLFGRNSLIAQVAGELGIVGEGPQHRMFPEVFAENGYHTATIGKLHHGAPTSGFQDVPEVPELMHANWFGLSKGLDPEKYGIVPIDAPGIFAGTFPAPASETETAVWTDKAIEYLNQDVQSPFLMRLSLRAPHTPVLPPEPWDTMFDPADMPIPEVTEDELTWMAKYDLRQLHYEFTESQIRKTWASYYGLAAFVDHEVGRLLDALAASPYADNTIVVFCADHGTHLNEHGRYQKSTFYDVSARVPFIVSWPGKIPEGKRVDSLVELIDMAPTLLDLCGLSIPSDMDGKSLRKTMDGAEREPHPAVFSEIHSSLLTGGDWLQGEPPGSIRRMVRTPDWNMSVTYPEDPLYGPDGALFNLSDDPGEVKNVYYDGKYREQVAQLSGQLVDWVEG